MYISDKIKLKNLFFAIIFSLVVCSCAGISKEDILKIPKEQDIETPSSDLPDKEDDRKNTAIFEYPPDKVWNAANESIYWIKWKPFMNDKENNVLVLKEAYVYENADSIKRIYNWPPMKELEKSDLSDYLEKVSMVEDGDIRKNTMFTQENMRIRITGESGDKTRVTILYEVIPHLRDGEIGNILTSSFYIESIVLNKISENLGSTENTR